MGENVKRNSKGADELVIFGGTGSPKLTGKICDYLKTKPGAGEVLRFSDGNLFVRIKENVRGRDVYIVQSTVFPTNDNFMELLFWIDALKRASAQSVTVVMPYFSYAKGDKKDEPRVSIRARVCADAIAVAGADRVVTLDLHAAQIQGFFRIPVDDLYALPVLGKEIQRKKLPDLVVVSPDTGFANKRASTRRSSAPPSRSRTNSARRTMSAPRSSRSSARCGVRPRCWLMTSRSPPGPWPMRRRSSSSAARMQSMRRSLMGSSAKARWSASSAARSNV